MSIRSRDEHLEWAKRQAREHEVANAIASICSDLRKHPDFAGIVEKLMPLGLLCVRDNDLEEARRFVEGFR